jgi:primosomal protein N' (replication factor Y) (superfamily II helicase)
VDKDARVILKVALDTPLRRVFDYLPPADAPAIDDPTDGPAAHARATAQSSAFAPGVRVRVPFGRREVIGVLVGSAEESALPRGKLRRALEILDSRPVFDPVTFDLLCWSADYYHHPIGEVLAAALPAGLKAGERAEAQSEVWTLTTAGREALEHPGRRAPRRRALLARLAQAGGSAEIGGAGEEGTAGAASDDPVEGSAEAGDPSDAGGAKHPGTFKRSDMRALARLGLVTLDWARPEATEIEIRPSEVTLTEAQAAVIASIRASLGRFAPHLLYGVTGSGKTEVYLQAIATAVAGGDGQALVLVPEIALTPQLVARFQARFGAGVVTLHSALAPSKRRAAWRAAHGGQARIVIGTRSAVFTSMRHLKLIVVDEEHDASYKQQEGFRYSARDLAVLRAQRAQIPVVLGSATPSLETLENAAQGRYVELRLPQRPGGAQPPRMHLVDLRKHPAEQGISQPALHAIGDHVGRGGQVIVFLNRRGYAPTLFCSACGWVAQCAHCDARMTLHRRAAELRCHHCGARTKVPSACGSCRQSVSPVGQGTERIEETLERLFPAAPLARLDRDTAGGQAAMNDVLDRVHRGEARILVGTQMLTKGHHFPDVSLVVILDADQGLFASDFRATERLAQTITQVAGRAGRASRPGEVMVQTSFPEHPLLTRLIASGYESFAVTALEERRAANWPPYSRLALLRAEARDAAALDTYLKSAAARAERLATGGVEVLGPAAAVIARKADHYRAHLLVESAARAPLQRFLSEWLPLVDALRGPPGLRWSVDVDPLEVD